LNNQFLAGEDKMKTFFMEAYHSFWLPSSFSCKLFAVSQVSWENKLQKPIGSVVYFFIKIQVRNKPMRYRRNI